MMHRMILVAVLAVGFTAQAQLSVAEAQAKLAERDAARKAERAKVVTITAGELADLRAELAQLKAELAAAKGATTTAVKPVRKVYQEIEIGMTKDEVMSFIRQRKNLRISSIRAKAPTDRQNKPSVVRTKGSLVADDRATGDTVAVGGKEETIVIERLRWDSVKVGSQRNTLGGSTPIYDSVERVDGTIRVTLTDGIVDSVEAG